MLDTKKKRYNKKTLIKNKIIMAEQQLIDYITKAREAGQSDDQTRDLLSKNGWTNIEINSAIMAVASGKMGQPETQPAPATQPEPQISVQPAQQIQPAQAEPQAITQPEVTTQSQTQSMAQPQPIIDISDIELPTEVTAQPQTEIQQQAEPIMQPEAQPEPQIQAQPAQPEIVSEPEPQLQPREDFKIETRPEPVSISRPEPQPQANYAQENLPRMRGGSHVILKLLIVLIIVTVLGGVGYFAAGQYFNLPYSNFFSNLLSNFFPSNPQAVINKMTVNMKNFKASQSITDLEIGITENKLSQGNIKVLTNTSIDKTDVKNLKALGNFTIVSTMKDSPDSAVSASVNIAIIGNNYFIKVNDIAVPTSSVALSPSELDLTKLKGKWFKFDQESMKVLSEANGETTVPDISKIVNSDLSKKFQDILIAENMFIFNKQLNDEKISEQDTYHYQITVDKTKLLDSITKSISLAVQEASKAQTSLNTTETTNIASSSKLIENMAQVFVKTTLDSIEDINMDIWIGKKDYMLYQVKLDKNIELNKILEGLGMGALQDLAVKGVNATGTTGATNVGTELVIEFNMTNSNFNKAITVQTPEGAQKIEEVLLPLMKSKNSNSELKQIGYFASSIFQTEKSYSTLCTRGLLNGYQKTYGEGLIALNNKIVNNGAKKPVCFANASNYCISTQLASGDYACIGNDGIIGKIKCLSALTVCK
jgi:hypothetical protein